MRFPMFVDIENKNILVVGAGKIGCRRIKTLLMFGADITVISESIEDEKLIESVRFVKRKFEKKDIDNKFFVVAATNDRKVNNEISKLCRERNIPVSVADCSDESTFFFPAVCVSDNICIGIVSDGSHHELVRDTAKKIRGNLL